MHINSTLPAFTASAGHVTSTSSSTFTCGGHTDTNGSGKTYVAFIFAHDDAQFGTDRDESIIKCGTYTGNGGQNRNIVTGFQPQWVLIAKSSFEHEWYIFDNQRSYYYIRTENASQEHNGTNLFKGFPSNGFMVNGNGGTNGNGDEFIYMAISA
jgi:hypothetical protein